MKPTKITNVEWTLGEPDGIQIRTISDWFLSDTHMWQIERAYGILTESVSPEHFDDIVIEIAPQGIEAALFRMRDEIIQQALDWKHEPDNID